MRFCSDCSETKVDADFSTFIRKDNGKRRFRSYCRKCDTKRRTDHRRAHPNRTKHRLRYQRFKQQIESGSLPHIAQRVFGDCKKSDKKRGLSCDLDIEFVESMVAKPCTYCGESERRRSLDRIDNALGHLKSNVVTACLRCNLTRANMPHQAWLVIADAMRAARVRGLFGDWFGIKTYT